MKTFPHSLKNFLVFLFFVFTTISFSQTVTTFNTAGTGSWLCPAGVTSIKIEAWGGGGGGGYARATNNGAAGGGAGGEYTYSNTITVVPGTTYYYRVGAGGTGGTGGGTAATAGESSCFSTATNCGGTILTSANGGNAGASVSTNASGAGGTGGTGGVFTGGGAFKGGNGANGLNGNGASFGGGGGGGGASTLGNGGNATNRTGGSGTGVGGGNGGSGASNTAGTNGSNIGGGGAGGHKNNNNRGGGDGGIGQIRITYTIPGLANDNCNNATPLTINTSCSYATYTTVGATASTTPSTPPVPGCASYSGGDVWFSFVVPANGEVTVDTQTGGMTDSGMAWYTGTCGALTLLECDDDDSANGLMSSITRTGLTPGTTIYVRVWEYGNDNQGTFGICATSPGPCTTPGSQATGFTAGTLTSNSFPATFSGTADSYLVIRSTSATPPSAPVNGVVYTGANIGTLGAGLTMVQNGTSTSIPGTGLTGNTRYYYYIYAYNNSGCSGGPLYNASGPLTGNAVTCPAAPSPVNTSSTLTSINFSWPSSLGGGINGVTYELEVTTDAGYTADVAGSPFTINDPTTTFNLTGLTANTTYYYRIRANNGCWSTYTTGIATTGYCTFGSTTSTYWISNFSTTGGSTNINRNSTYSAGGYGNYSATDIVTQILGQSFNFSTTLNSGTHGVNIYVDWNNDLDFNDASELVYASGAYVSSTTGTITIPGGTTVGNHRMRVVANYFDTNPSACGSYSYTEAEDYTINVVAPAACAGTPNAGTTTVTPNTGWPGSNYSVTATGYSIASNLTFQWQYSTNGGTSWNNAGASTSSYSNYTATAPASGVVQWQLVVTCTNSGQIATSTIGTFTTLAVSDVATGCPNVVSGGLGLNGADPAPFDCTASATCVNLEATYLDLGETTNYIVEPIAYNPPFAFTGLANPIVLGTDDYWSNQIVDLPFDFCYFGNTYDKVLPGPNGALTFDTSLVGAYAGYSFSNNLPSTTGALFNNTIYGVYHDINSTYGGQFGWELVTLSTGCKALVVAYNDVPMFSNNAILYSGMIVLYENSNIIEIYVKEKKIDNFNVSPWNDGNAIIGLQNSDGTIAVVPPGRNGLDPNWEATGEAWRFVPNGNSIASIAWYEGATATGPVLGTNDTLNVCPTATTTYTAEITYTLCDGRTIKETDTTTVTVNGAKVWNGSVNTDWNVANNWTPIGVPTATDCVVIPDTANDPIISGTNYNGLGLNLTVNNNATLTVTPNNDLTIKEWVNINPSGDLVLQNSASLIQINNDVNQGNMHMTRTANIRKLDYVYWSSPVTSFSVNSISPATTNYKYKWIPTIPSNTNGWGNWANANENMVIGKGYIVRGPDSFTSTITPFNAVFTGTPNNGIITTPIARGGYVGANYMAASGTLATQFDDNWNLIGNPYPSSINAINFLTANPNINGFINIWTHGTLPSTAISDPFYNDYAYNYTSSDYITYNSSGASTGPGTFGGYIGAGQGFFVLMNNTNVAATENVTFNNTMRSSAYDNAQFFRASDESGRIWLDLIASNGNTVRNLVAYVDGATNNKDRMFDAIGSEKLNFNLYSTIGNEIMKIQGRTLPFDQEDRVPMGIKVSQNGNYTIGIGAVDGFFTNDNQNIYIEDKVTNIIHDLRQNPYSFTAEAGNYPNRFILRYTNETLGGDDLVVDEANLWVISSDVLSVKSTKNTIQSIRVFDVLGRHLAYYPNVEGYEARLTTIQKNNAGLIIQVTLSNGTVINKKIIY